MKTTTNTNSIQELPFSVSTITPANGDKYAEARMNDRNWFLSIARAELSVDDQYVSGIHFNDDKSASVFIEAGHYCTLSSEEVATMVQYMPDSLRAVCDEAINKIVF